MAGTNAPKKDLPPKSSTKVKGGGLAGSNDNITLERAAKPKVTGKDLAPKSPATVKGGGLNSANDNITLVRRAM